MGSQGPEFYRVVDNPMFVPAPLSLSMGHRGIDAFQLSVDLLLNLTNRGGGIAYFCAYNSGVAGSSSYGIYNLTGRLVIPLNVVLKVAPGAMLNPLTALDSIVVQGTIDAGVHQIFGSS